MEKALLVGNGINRINSTKSWESLLDDLIDYADKTGSFSTKGKPFTFLYEEILLRAIRFRDKSEDDLRKHVCRIIGMLEHNNIHKELLSLDFKNIITTNYDYNFEYSWSNDKQISYGTAPGHNKERLYRLHTYNKVEEKKIWHIHGEIHYPETLVLGHEKYSRTLQNIINYTGDGVVSNKDTLSWIDLFFNTDIHILGLSLDYSEIDLWWILNHRARLLKEYAINNSIIYYVPSFEYRTKNFKEKNEMFFAHNVIVSSIDAVDYNEFYLKMINELKGTVKEQEISA